MFTVAETSNLPFIKPLHLISACYIDSGLSGIHSLAFWLAHLH